MQAKIQPQQTTANPAIMATGSKPMAHPYPSSSQYKPAGEIVLDLGHQSKATHRSNKGAILQQRQAQMMAIMVAAGQADKSRQTSQTNGAGNGIKQVKHVRDLQRRNAGQGTIFGSNLTNIAIGAQQDSKSQVSSQTTELKKMVLMLEDTGGSSTDKRKHKNNHQIKQQCFTHRGDRNMHGCRPPPKNNPVGLEKQKPQVAAVSGAMTARVPNNLDIQAELSPRPLLNVHRSNVGQIPVTDALGENIQDRGDPQDKSVQLFTNRSSTNRRSVSAARHRSHSSASIKGRRLSPHTDLGCGENSVTVWVPSQHRDALEEELPTFTHLRSSKLQQAVLGYQKIMANASEAIVGSVTQRDRYIVSKGNSNQQQQLNGILKQPPVKTPTQPNLANKSVFLAQKIQTRSQNLKSQPKDEQKNRPKPDCNQQKLTSKKSSKQEISSKQKEQIAPKPTQQSYQSKRQQQFVANGMANKKKKVSPFELPLSRPCQPTLKKQSPTSIITQQQQQQQKQNAKTTPYPVTQSHTPVNHKSTPDLPPHKQSTGNKEFFDCNNSTLQTTHIQQLREKKEQFGQCGQSSNNCILSTAKCQASSWQNRCLCGQTNRPESRGRNTIEYDKVVDSSKYPRPNSNIELSSKYQVSRPVSRMHVEPARSALGRYESRQKNMIMNSKKLNEVLESGGTGEQLQKPIRQTSSSSSSREKYSRFKKSSPTKTNKSASVIQNNQKSSFQLTFSQRGDNQNKVQFLIQDEGNLSKFVHKTETNTRTAREGHPLAPSPLNRSYEPQTSIKTNSKNKLPENLPPQELKAKPIEYPNQQSSSLNQNPQLTYSNKKDSRSHSNEDIWQTNLLQEIPIKNKSSNLMPSKSQSHLLTSQKGIQRDMMKRMLEMYQKALIRTTQENGERLRQLQKERDFREDLSTFKAATRIDDLTPPKSQLKKKKEKKEIQQIQQKCRELRKQRRALEAKNKELRLNLARAQREHLMMPNIITSISAQNSIIAETNTKIPRRNRSPHLVSDPSKSLQKVGKRDQRSHSTKKIEQRKQSASHRGDLSEKNVPVENKTDLASRILQLQKDSTTSNDYKEKGRSKQKFQPLRDYRNAKPSQNTQSSHSSVPSQLSQHQSTSSIKNLILLTNNLKPSNPMFVAAQATQNNDKHGVGEVLDLTKEQQDALEKDKNEENLNQKRDKSNTNMPLKVGSSQFCSLDVEKKIKPKEALQKETFTLQKQKQNQNPLNSRSPSYEKGGRSKSRLRSVSSERVEWEKISGKRQKGHQERQDQQLSSVALKNQKSVSALGKHGKQFETKENRDNKHFGERRAFKQEHGMEYFALRKQIAMELPLSLADKKHLKKSKKQAVQKNTKKSERDKSQNCKSKREAIHSKDQQRQNKSKTNGNLEEQPLAKNQIEQATVESNFQQAQAMREQHKKQLVELQKQKWTQQQKERLKHQLNEQNRILKNLSDLNRAARKQLSKGLKVQVQKLQRKEVKREKPRGTTISLKSEHEISDEHLDKYHVTHVRDSPSPNKSTLFLVNSVGDVQHSQSQHNLINVQIRIPSKQRSDEKMSSARIHGESNSSQKQSTHMISPKQQKLLHKYGATGSAESDQTSCRQQRSSHNYLGSQAPPIAEAYSQLESGAFEVRPMKQSQSIKKMKARQRKAEQMPLKTTREKMINTELQNVNLIPSKTPLCRIGHEPALTPRHASSQKKKSSSKKRRRKVRSQSPISPNKIDNKYSPVVKRSPIQSKSRSNSKSSNKSKRRIVRPQIQKNSDQVQTKISQEKEDLIIYLILTQAATKIQRAYMAYRAKKNHFLEREKIRDKILQELEQKQKARSSGSRLDTPNSPPENNIQISNFSPQNIEKGMKALDQVQLKSARVMSNKGLSIEYMDQRVRKSTVEQKIKERSNNFSFGVKELSVAPTQIRHTIDAVPLEQDKARKSPMPTKSLSCSTSQKSKSQQKSRKRKNRNKGKRTTIDNPPLSANQYKRDRASLMKGVQGSPETEFYFERPYEISILNRNAPYSISSSQADNVNATITDQANSVSIPQQELTFKHLQPQSRDGVSADLNICGENASSLSQSKLDIISVSKDTANFNSNSQTNTFLMPNTLDAIDPQNQPSTGDDANPTIASNKINSIGSLNKVQLNLRRLPKQQQTSSIRECSDDNDNSLSNPDLSSHRLYNRGVHNNNKPSESGSHIESDMGIFFEKAGHLIGPVLLDSSNPIDTSDKDHSTSIQANVSNSHSEQVTKIENDKKPQIVEKFDNLIDKNAEVSFLGALRNEDGKLLDKDELQGEQRSLSGEVVQHRSQSSPPLVLQSTDIDLVEQGKQTNFGSHQQRSDKGKVKKLNKKNTNDDAEVSKRSLMRAVSGDERFLINHEKAGMPNSYTNTDQKETQFIVSQLGSGTVTQIPQTQIPLLSASVNSSQSLDSDQLIKNNSFQNALYSQGIQQNDYLHQNMSQVSIEQDSVDCGNQNIILGGTGSASLPSGQNSRQLQNYSAYHSNSNVNPCYSNTITSSFFLNTNASLFDRNPFRDFTASKIHELFNSSNLQMTTLLQYASNQSCVEMGTHHPNKNQAKCGDGTPSNSQKLDRLLKVKGEALKYVSQLENGWLNRQEQLHLLSPTTVKRRKYELEKWVEGQYVSKDLNTQQKVNYDGQPSELDLKTGERGLNQEEQKRHQDKIDSNNVRQMCQQVSQIILEVNRRASEIRDQLSKRQRSFDHLNEGQADQYSKIGNLKKILGFGNKAGSQDAAATKRNPTTNQLGMFQSVNSVDVEGSMERPSEDAFVEINVVDQGNSSQKSGSQNNTNKKQPFEYKTRNQELKDQIQSQGIKSSSSEVIWEEAITIMKESKETISPQDIDCLEISNDNLNIDDEVEHSDKDAQPTKSKKSKSNSSSSDFDVNIKMTEQITDRIFEAIVNDCLGSEKLSQILNRKEKQTIISDPNYTKNALSLISPPLGNRLKPDFLMQGELQKPSQSVSKLYEPTDLEINTEPNFNINQEITGGEQIIAGVDTSLEAVEQYIEGIFAQIRFRGKQFMGAFYTPIYRNPVQMLSKLQKQSPFQQKGNGGGPNDTGNLSDPIKAGANTTSSHSADLTNTLASILNVQLYLTLEKARENVIRDALQQIKEAAEGEDLVINENLSELLSESDHIHNKAIFDGVNEALNLVRPYGNKGEPMPWSSRPRKNYFQFASVEDLEDVLAQVKAYLIEWCDTKAGQISQSIVVSDEQGPPSQKQSDQIQVNKPDDVKGEGSVIKQTHIQNISEESLAMQREKCLAKILTQDVLLQEEKWLDYENEETQVKIDLADYILEHLVEEIAQDLTKLA